VHIVALTNTITQAAGRQLIGYLDPSMRSCRLGSFSGKSGDPVVPVAIGG